MTYRIALILFCLCLPAAQADTLILQNGDRLQGTYIKTAEGQIHFETPQLGLLTLPADSVTLEVASQTPAAPAQPEDTPDEEVAETSYPWWQVWNHTLPENWDGEVSAAFVKENDEDSSTDLNLGTKVNWQKSQQEKFAWKTFYNYETTNNVKDTDEWGISQDYRYDFAPRWFLRSNTANHTDQIIDKRWDIEQVLGVGYRIIDTDRTQLSVIPGFGVNYVDQPSPGDGTFMTADFTQEFEWKAHEQLILFEDFNYVTEVSDTDNYEWILNLGLESPLTERLSLRLVYTYEYNNIVPAGTDDTDTKLSAAAVLKF